MIDGKGPRVALSTGSLHNWCLDRVFELAGEAGYDGVELLVDARMDSYEVPYLRRLVEQWRIPILSVHTPFAARVEGWPEAPEGRVQQAVRLAECLGAETVIAHAPLRWSPGHLAVAVGQRCLQVPFGLPWPSRGNARYATWLRDSLPDFQAHAGVHIAVENMPARRLWGRRVDMHRCRDGQALRQFPYLVLDTTHCATHAVDPLVMYRELRERIIHVHLANYDGRQHRLPHKGDLRLEGLLAEMRLDGFGGTVVVEAEPWAVAEGDWTVSGVRRALAEAAAWTRGWLGVPSHSHADTTQRTRTAVA